ncbi:MAG TPA: hypothetical protein VLV45_10955 [Gemmatimonadales bacterium]|nr:hypothetical protein [Gemmatimonadales bacterium]
MSESRAWCCLYKIAFRASIAPTGLALPHLGGTCAAGPQGGQLGQAWLGWWSEDALGNRFVAPVLPDATRAPWQARWRLSYDPPAFH